MEYITGTINEETGKGKDTTEENNTSENKETVES